MLYYLTIFYKSLARSGFAISILFRQNKKAPGGALKNSSAMFGITRITRLGE
jgi:hypothetical protein